MTREQLIKHWDVIQAFKEGKEIQCRKIGSEQWNNEHGGFEFRLNYEYREKPEEPKPTKRLPTIEEVEKWFMENRVFMYKKNGVYTRIESFDKNDKITTIKIGTQGWISIDQFVERYCNIDGSELYITEN